MATTGKNLSEYDKNALPFAEGLRIGIVVSEWNASITENLFQGALQTLLEIGIARNNIVRLNVPGSFELIYGSRWLATHENLGAVVALGSVIRGETPHFDYVCSAVAQGIKDLNLQLDIPVIFGLLTDDNEQQALDRSGGKHGNKGVECAVAAVKMARLQIKPKN
jgi:6,7-dimethyl-8-ribityllumazine synthase